MSHTPVGAGLHSRVVAAAVRALEQRPVCLLSPANSCWIGSLYLLVMQEEECEVKAPVGT